MPKFYLFLFLLCGLGRLNTFAQDFHHVAFTGDTLVLSQTDYCGQSIQWEFQAPGGDWESLSGATVNNYEWIANEELQGTYRYRAQVRFAPDTLGRYTDPIGVRYVSGPQEVQASDKYQEHHIFHVANDTLYAAYRSDAYREWGCFGTIIDNTYGQGIGHGITNTAAILSQCDTSSTAAYYCDTMTISGFTDWFLPSADELLAVASELSHLGEFNFNKWCWSSTQIPTTYYDFQIQKLALAHLFPYADSGRSNRDKDKLLNVVATRQITDFSPRRTVMKTTFAPYSYRGFIQTRPAVDSLTNIIVEYIGTQAANAIYHWDFDGGEVITGSGVGPYEIRYDHSRQNQVKMSFEDEFCTSAVFESAFFTVDVFEDLHLDLPTVYGGCLRTADFNNDGWPDIAVTGSDTTALYFGDGENLVQLDYPWPALSDSYLSAGDFNNDGYVDLALCGRQASNGEVGTFLYQNLDGETFSPWPHNLPALSDGFIEWLDYNNDGKLDLLLSGEQGDGSPLTQLYTGDREGNFIQVPTSLPQLMRSSVSIDDYNRDGYSDIFLLGFDGNDRHSVLYKNTPMGFVPLPLDLIGVSRGTVAWADYNQDGLLDFAYSGNKDSIQYTLTGNSISVRPQPALLFRFYQNLGNDTFQYDSLLLENTVFPDIFAQSDLSWADFNGDGADDLAITGIPAIQWVSVGIGGNANLANFPFRSMPTLFKNTGTGNFTTHHVNIPLYYASVGTYGRPRPTPSQFECSLLRFIDFNGDQRPDLIREGRGTYPHAAIYTNQLDIPNASPETPTGLAARAVCDSVLLSWNSSNDDHTPSTSLYYEVVVGTSAGADDIVSRHNQRRLRKPGLSLFDLEAGTYYWRVRAIDNALAKSEYAEARTFTIGLPMEAIIYQSNDTLYSNYSQGNQWYNVNGPIANATDSILVVDTEGIYYTVVSLNDCFTATSNRLEVFILDNDNFLPTDLVTIFPNPTDGLLDIRTPSTGSYQLYASDGRRILEGPLTQNTQISLMGLPKGIYGLAILLADGRKIWRRIVKS